MKVVAILDINEQQLLNLAPEDVGLEEQFVHEMGWVEASGITLESYEMYEKDESIIPNEGELA